MARLSNPGRAAIPQTSDLDRSSAELGQLLLRLQRTVLHADPAREQRLRTSEYERAKLETNLDYARTSLSRLEQEAMTLLAPGRKGDVQADLYKKRELLELLVDRLHDFQKMAVEDDEDASEGEDLLASVGYTPSESISSTSAATPSDADQEAKQVQTPTPKTSQPPAPATEPGYASSESTPFTPDEPTKTTQNPRSRNQETQQPSYASARAALFANRKRTDPAHAAATTGVSTATAEAILDQQAGEREDLSDKVFKMAQAMKEKQLSIASSLDAEKDIMGRATEGMERTGRGMEAAKGTMGSLMRMSEGKGWWGRIMLYAWIYGLMVALVLLVFVMPKLRF
ncbi:synaptobrevin [Emericellopsis atlantica]|uniref:Synaptobrevin n=1 Tax=Emericellopsis atlantica TaxID=2614577 RepID=A0A9P7ZKU6_9HYPO|nr:synaptobrevin [Emericellopsis atlantica]KAG9253855.1 synaptobrevin [Emericellopsis atlantica]